MLGHYVLWIILLWIPMMLLHELGHYYYARHILKANASLELWWWKDKIPSLIVRTDKVDEYFYLAGGITSAFCLGILGLMAHEPAAYVLFVLTILQVAYGFYEYFNLPLVASGKLKKDRYMVEHYAIYFVMLFVGWIGYIGRYLI